MTTDYQRYLASREWAVKRTAVRDRAEGLCERCRARPMTAVHHLTYAHVGAEPLEDLQAICGECHAFLSGQTDIDPITRAQDTANLVTLLEFASAILLAHFAEALEEPQTSWMAPLWQTIARLILAGETVDWKSVEVALAQDVFDPSILRVLGTAKSDRYLEIRAEAQ